MVKVKKMKKRQAEEETKEVFCLEQDPNVEEKSKKKKKKKRGPVEPPSEKADVDLASDKAALEEEPGVDSALDRADHKDEDVDYRAISLPPMAFYPRDFS
jgi:hypothetical protein